MSVKFRTIAVSATILGSAGVGYLGGVVGGPQTAQARSTQALTQGAPPTMMHGGGHHPGMSRMTAASSAMHIQMRRMMVHAPAMQRMHARMTQAAPSMQEHMGR
ncbi:hypothetical protein NBH00_21960 [Paraconexibacter antarcticus]|uniref:Uncharacterized protein n=1 Tax=Paraconexibacter antarcticus TaxID=2949664 RepID=A0ABY5DQV7_9ACTN|nr:hypothetical protein [Paraconexibacter antarcticus]UTI63994.1 hypothetical protein NBH00_21960 [Paraconexibacter antarcticus]